MRCADISTGSILASRSCVQADNRVLASPGKIILFSPETPQGTLYSPSIPVPAGTAVLIDAYNLPLTKKIWVNRIVKSTTAPIGGSNCDPCALTNAYGTEGVVVFRARMTLGGAPSKWVLYDDGVVGSPNVQLQLLLAVPGMYELELEDTHMLGDLEVEYMTWSLAQTPHLPKNYFGGSL